jgi:5-methyltetrahydrofolate--homocysteine methyltransferase
LKDRAAEINRIAAEISREAAGPELHVAGSMGPSGKMLLMGETTESELYDSFSLQAVALEKGGADCALVETMIDMTEFSMAARAVRENTKLEILATASFDKTPNGYRTLMGVSIEDMCGAALAEGASVIGTNCGYGTEMMIEIVREMRRLFPLAPILVQPNAGLPIVADDGRLEFPETPEYMASLAPKLVSAGANIVGGCCGTTSEHTRAIRQAIKA